METARDGNFDFGIVFEGKYEIEVQHGYRTTTWPVRVTNEVPRLARADLRVIGFPRDPSRPPASARLSAVPTYPLGARGNGIDGVVVLRVTQPYGKSQTISVASGPPSLAAAALENVRTWDLRVAPDATDLDITYRYVLLSGDCNGDDGPFIELKPPTSVTVSMKRIVPCRQ